MEDMNIIKDAYIVPNPTGPTVAVAIDPELCIGCNDCANVCRIQTILPNPEPGKPPVVVYPDECWYCGDSFEPDVIGGLDAGLHPVLYRAGAEERLVRLTDGAGREYLAVNHWNALEEHLTALADAR